MALHSCLSPPNAARIGIESPSPARWNIARPLASSMPAFVAPTSEPARFQRPATVVRRTQVIEGDWNTRLLFGKGAVSSEGGVREVDKDTFWPTVESAGDKLVVLDMYTRWCGPCRTIYPKLVKLSGIYKDVIFLKILCIPENKPLTSKLGIGILPTFKIFKNKFLVSEVKGAKYDELIQKIEKARLS